MQNWIGVAVWIVLGMLIGLSMKVLIKQPEETPGHATLLAVLGGFGALVGGMLGVGIFHLWYTIPPALSPGGFGGAIFLAAFMSGIYRWGIRGLI